MIAEKNGFNLTLGTKHLGQGTANRSILFAENYVELIFLESLKAGTTKVFGASFELQLRYRSNGLLNDRSPRFKGRAVYIFYPLHRVLK